MIKRKATLGVLARRVLSVFIFAFFIAVLAVSWAQGRDFSWALKNPIETRLTAEIGHPVTVEGRVGFFLNWNEVQVFADSITTNLGEETSALEASVFAERAGVALDLRALLRGRAELRGLLLREAQITLPVPDDATLDGQPADRNPDYIFRTLNRLHRVTLDNLTLIRMRRNAEPQTAEVDSLIIAPEGEGLHAAFVGDVEGTPYDVDGVIADLESFLNFEGSPATIRASIGTNQVEGQGTLTKVWPFEADLDLTGEAHNVARLAELLGGELPGAGAARLTGHLRLVERRAELTLSHLEIDHNGANGEAPELALGPAQGEITVVRNDENGFTVRGDLVSDLVHVDPLRAAPEGFVRRTVARVIETPMGTGLPFAERRIPYHDLQRYGGSFRLQADEFQFRDAIFENVTLPMSDADGVFRLDDASASYRGQRLSLSLTANAADQSIEIDADADDVQLGTLVEELGGESFIYGPARLAVRGRGRGATVGEIMQSFTGQSNLMLGRGHVERGGIDFLAADLLRAFFSENGQSTTPLVCLINRIDFEDGVGTSRAFLMDTNLITITGQGHVDLARNNINFRLAPRPKDPTLLSLAADYRVEGPIMNPTFTPQAGSLIRGVATTLGSLALTGGAAALLPLIAGGENEVENPCIAALTGEDVPLPDGEGGE